MRLDSLRFCDPLFYACHIIIPLKLIEAIILTRAIQKIVSHYSIELTCLPSGVPTPPLLYAALQALLAMGYSDVGSRLRVLRQITLHRLYTLDCEQGAPLGVVMQGMTDLAEVCLQSISKSCVPLCKFALWQ